MEDHKSSMHPNVWCSHYEFSGDQRELYKHLFLPGRSTPTIKAKNAIAPEKICTKCSKNCSTLAELHRHMLECGGDQAWLLGLFGNGKKKCKWRPFGSRSRRRRQRGMKRNIQNSQTPRTNVPREKQPAGPRVRPSDRKEKKTKQTKPKSITFLTSDTVFPIIFCQYINVIFNCLFFSFFFILRLVLIEIFLRNLKKKNKK